jgi:hypothetical protein
VGVNVINFGPIKLSFAVHTRFFIINSFAALFLCMVQNLAVDAEFTVSGSVVALILR